MREIRNTLEGFPIEQIKSVTPKKDIAPLFQIDPSTVQAYHKIALSCIPSYVNDFPPLDTKGDERNFRAPLTRYQVWVVWLLKEFVKTSHSSKKSIAAQIRNVPEIAEQFEEERFDELCEQYYKDMSEHEYKTILQKQKNNPPAVERIMSISA